MNRGTTEEAFSFGEFALHDVEHLALIKSAKGVRLTGGGMGWIKLERAQTIGPNTGNGRKGPREQRY